MSTWTGPITTNCGPSFHYVNTANWNSASTTTFSLNAQSMSLADITPNEKTITVVTPDGERIDLIATLKLVQEMAERMKVIMPLLEMHESYPALKAAYDAYRVVGKLCQSVEEEGKS